MTNKMPEQFGVNRAKKPKGWTGWREGNLPMSRPGTKKKKLPMPRPPKNLTPVKGEGVAGRI